MKIYGETGLLWSLRFLAALGLVGFQFTIFSVGDSPVTLGLLVFPSLVLWVIHPRVTVNAIILFSLTVTWTFLAALLYPHTQLLDFFLAFGLLFVSLVLIALAWGARTDSSRLRSVSLGLRDGLVALSVLTGIQFLESLRGGFVSFRVFDALVTARHYSAVPDSSGYLSRPFGPFVEPSFLVVISGLASIICILVLHRQLLVFSSFTVITVLAGSTTGFVLWCAVAAVSISEYRWRRGLSQSSRTPGANYGFSPQFRWIAGGAIAVFLAAQVTSLTGSSFIERVARVREIFADGTSGYARTTYAIKSSLHALGESPFGVPLGHSSLAVRDVPFGQTLEGVNVHNGIVLFLLHFSLWGILLVVVAIACLRHLIRSMRGRKDLASALVVSVLSVIVLAYAARGTPFNPDYVSLLILSVLGLKVCTHQSPHNEFSLVPRSTSSGLVQMYTCWHACGVLLRDDRVPEANQEELRRMSAFGPSQSRK